MLNKHLKHKLIAYSLLEILITIAIFSLLSVALMQSLMENIRLSAEITARSQIRSDINDAMTQIERDFRNANDINVTTCGTSSDSYPGLTGLSCQTSCEFKDNNNNFVVWCRVQNYYTNPLNKSAVLRLSKDGANPNWKITYKSSSLLDVYNMNFAVNISNELVQDYTPYANILVTLQAQNDPLGIHDQVRQISVTTRNYNIK